MHIHPQLTAGSWLSHSRPEGVTLERYQEFVIMNLSPLDEDQQRDAIRQQLKVHCMH